MKKDIDKNIGDVQKIEQNMSQQNSSRRAFIKKTVYAAPTLIVLGSLTHPKNVEAGKFGSTPPPPTW